MTDDRWYRRAACKGVTDPFYVERGNPNNYTKARQICANCPVQAECLDACLEEEAGERYRFGFRAGMNPDERAREWRRRKQRLAHTVACGTRAGYVRHLRRGEEPCGGCRRANAEYSAQLRGLSRDRQNGQPWSTHKVRNVDFDTPRRRSA